MSPCTRSGMDLDLAALSRSLRLPPSALRIVDLSALPSAAREAEAQRIVASGGELPPRLRVRVEVLADEPGEVDWLVLGPEIPRRVPEKIYDSPLDYWTERIPGLPPGPSLPAAEAPATPPPLRRRVMELDAETWGELRARAAWAGLSPAALLLAALADALAAWSASPRFVIELSVSGTPGGLWVPLELDGAAPGTFEERARAVQDRLRRDLAYPLARTVRPDGLGTLPVAVALPPKLFREQEDGEETGVATREVGAGRRTRSVREPSLLRLQAAEREGNLLLLWDVAEASFPSGLADALTGAARDALRRLSAAPAWREVRRRLIPPQQLSRMVTFNTTGAPLPEPFLYELFAARARRQPDRTAIAGPSGHRSHATYGELLRVADRLGHLLQRAGARRNAPVAVVLEPGWEAVAALLGVLAAGAACLPVDPALPRERFRDLLEHGRIELAVTREALAETLDWPEEIVGIMVEDADAILADPLPGGPPGVPSASPKDLACILFGPDGPVMLENRGVANLVVDLGRRFGIGPGDRTLAVSPLSMGAALFEVFGTLAAGGTVVVPAAPLQIEREEITVLAATPSFVEALLDAGCSPLPRVVLLHGDALPADLPERIRRTRPGARIAWLWGALETSVWTAVREIGEREEAGGRPFGRPVANQSVHVLDGRLELRPFWVPGDLYVGGIGLARGYWRDPARSAARFAIHPDTGERLLRTGDRARWLPGGDIELLEPDL